MIFGPYRFLKNDKVTRYSKIVRSGYVRLPNSDGVLRTSGLGADYWSSHSDALATAHNLYFGANNVSPSGGPNPRYFAFPLRYLRHVGRGMQRCAII